MLFSDRRAAGQVLSHHLEGFAGREQVLVLSLARGGVPVGAEIARLLNLPLDIFVVRKLGCPGREELALGALASGGVQVLNVDLLADLNIDRATVAEIAAREAEEIRRREEVYRGDRPPLEVHGRTVLVVDDGLATGATMSAALLALRKMGVAEAVAVAPVGSPATCRRIERLSFEVVCPYRPEDFQAVGDYYDDFTQTSDDEVRAALAR
jgi:predicted phosphoribosyltransferase